MPAKRKNYEKAVEMYISGLSIQNIAYFYGITRQSMHLSLKRRGVVFRKNIREKDDNVFYRGGKTQDERAIQIYKLALEKGIIKKTLKCEKCGAIGKTEGHHDSYDSPLNVRFLCHKCHYIWHLSNKASPAISSPVKLTRVEICSLGGRSLRKKAK